MKTASGITLLLAIVVGISCDDGEIGNRKEFRWTSNAIVQGSATYTDIKTNSVKQLPASTLITVEYKNDQGVTHTNYSFKTTDAGKYNFVPPLQGTYTFSVALEDTILQFSKKIVTEYDTNAVKLDKFGTIGYKDSVGFKVETRNFYQLIDIVLGYKGTSLLITVTDEEDNPIPKVKLCLFSNEDFYDENFPNCGGSIAYLETKADGTALFTNLHENQKYYVNARGAVGVTELNNHYDEDAQETEMLDPEVVNQLTIVVKK